MTRPRWKTWVALLVVALVAQAAAETAFLVGGGRALWLVLSEDDSYQVAVKWGDKPWARLPAKLQGEVAAATVVGDAALVFFNSGRSVRYSPHQQEPQYGVKPPESLWPSRDASVLSACPVEGDGAALVLVSRSVRPEPPTRPTQPRPETTAPPARAVTATAVVSPLAIELALLRLDGQQWRQLAVAGPERVGWPSRAHIAAANGKVFLLLARPERKLLALDQGLWKKLPLPAKLAGGRTLALIALREQLLLAVFNPAGAGRVGLARYASGKWEQVRFLRAGGEELTWPAEEPPAVGRAAETLAAAWQERGKWFVGHFDLQGQRIRPVEDAFASAEAVESARKAKDYLLWGVLGVLVALMFWPGRTVRTVPFSPPPTMRPARLGRRALASLIDGVPFFGVAFYLSGGPDPVTFLRWIWQRPVQVEHIYPLLGLVAYSVYSIFLEQAFGATFGKMAMRVRVIGDAGKRPSLREIALRNISKIPEVFIFPLLVFPLFTRYRQRLGDKIAWTTVIDMELISPPQEPTQGPPDGAGRDQQEPKP